jgi:putative ABC transport system permease protein
MLSHLRQAYRSALRQPAFTVVIVATLALGIGATTAVFALVHAALLEPLPYAEPDRLVLARRTVDARVLMWSSAPDYYDYREQTEGFASLGRITGAGARRVTIAGGDRPERVLATAVSEDLFSTLGVSPVEGRGFTESEARAGAPYVVMVSERLARRRFGTAASAVGRALPIAGLAAERVSATVVGVMPDTFRFLYAVDLWTVVRRGENDGPATRRFHNWVLVGRLKPGVSIEAAQGQVDVVSGRLQQAYPETNRTKALRLDPLQSALVERQRPRLLLLAGAVVLVLLIACANVAGLLLARGAARRSEFAVRAALGASRRRLAGQLLGESLMLGVAGGAAGVGIALVLEPLLPHAAGLAGSGVAATTLDWTVLGFGVAVSILSGGLAGVAPALRVSAVRPGSDLGPGARSTDSRAGSRLRSLLVVAQVAVSLFLLVGAGLLIRSLASLSSTELGFDPHNVLTAEIQLAYAAPEKRVEFFTGLRDDLAATPGVTAVSFTSHIPVRDPAGDPPVWAEGRPPVDSTQERSAALRVVLPGYFDVLRVPLLAGRDLAETDRENTPLVLVINETMARTFFPGENPVGKRVIMPGQRAQPMTLEVVGVVGDARIYSIGVRAPMTMYATLRQMPQRGSNLVVKTEMDPRRIAGVVRELVQRRDRDIAVDGVGTLDAVLAESLAPQRVITVALALFSGLALLLASLGLYGVLAYHVAQRTREIGVRIALGADPGRLLASVLSRSGVMVLPGLAIGLTAALTGTRLIAGLIYGVTPHDPWSIAGATLSLAFVALAASALPAWRAARVDPVEALRA